MFVLVFVSFKNPFPAVTRHLKKGFCSIDRYLGKPPKIAGRPVKAHRDSSANYGLNVFPIDHRRAHARRQDRAEVMCYLPLVVDVCLDVAHPFQEYVNASG